MSDGDGAASSWTIRRPRSASQDLAQLVSCGIVSQEGSRGGTVYRLTPQAHRADVRRQRHLAPRERAVLSVLSSAGAPLKTREIAEGTGMSRPTVLKALGNLMDGGWVEPTNDHVHARNRAYRAARPNEAERSRT